jgi:hypothetical protein
VKSIEILEEPKGLPLLAQVFLQDLTIEPPNLEFLFDLGINVFQYAAEIELRQMGIPRYLKDLQFVTKGN